MPPSDREWDEALHLFRDVLIQQHGSLEEAADAIDTSHSGGPGGFISKTELEEYFNKHLGIPGPQEQASNLHMLLDKNASGRLTCKEIVEVLSSLEKLKDKRVVPRSSTARLGRSDSQMGLKRSDSVTSKRASVDSNAGQATGKVKMKRSASKGSEKRHSAFGKTEHLKLPHGDTHHDVHMHHQKTHHDLTGQYLGFRSSTGQRDGFGVLRGKDGTTYSGQWLSGKRSGHGALFFEGGVFEGTWEKGNATGSGNVYFKNGDQFAGPYHQNRKEGHGKYVWADGANEEGVYTRGVKTGWHWWKRGAEHWDLHYENGTVTAATRGTAPPLTPREGLPENSLRGARGAGTPKTAALQIPGSRRGSQSSNQPSLKPSNRIPSPRTSAQAPPDPPPATVSVTPPPAAPLADPVEDAPEDPPEPEAF